MYTSKYKCSGVIYMTDIKHQSDIVKEYRIGNTKILISNAAYKNRTPEEIEKILRRITAIGWVIVESARAKGKDM